MRIKYFVLRFLQITLILHLVLASSTAQENFDCFTIIVGKDASVDGSLIVAHNEDDFGKQMVNLYKSPRKSHAGNEVVKFNNGGTISQINTTNGFIWIELPGMEVADSYFNDKGVLITSNGCPSREDTPDSTDGGILYWMRRLVAERANNAREGVKIAGRLIDYYGYVSSGRTYTIADQNEAWVLSAVYGKHWIAQRVPDDQLAVIPNYYTVGEIDLADTINYLGSADIISHAVAKGWYNPESGDNFHFAKAYTALTSINHPGNINRIWRGINLLSERNFDIDKELPFSFTPYKKIDVMDLMTILRDHYELSALDKSDMYSKGNPHFENYATICSESTQYSFIAQLRANMPAEIGTLIWFTYFRPCAHAYAPVYLGLQNFPDDFAYTDADTAIKKHFAPGDTIFNPNSTDAYWDFVSAMNKIDKDFKEIYPRIKNFNSFSQDKLLRKTKLFEKDILKLFTVDRQSAMEKINKYSGDNLMFIRKRAKDFVKSKLE